MTIPIKKVIDIIHDLFRIGKGAAKDIQISGDAALARRIKRAIEEVNAKKLRKIVERGGILVDGKDVYGVVKHKTLPGVIVSIDFIVRYIMMKRIIKRYRRKEG